MLQSSTSSSSTTGNNSNTLTKPVDITSHNKWMLFDSLVSLPQGFTLKKWKTIDKQISAFLSEQGAEQQSEQQSSKTTGVA